MSNFVLNHQYQEQFYQLYLSAFKGQDTKQRRAFWKYRFLHSKPYGIIQDNQLISGVLSLPFEVNFHGKNFLMNGICDVMTNPAFTGHGSASSLLVDAIKDMYQDHVTLSYLAPFSFKYYRKFGYEEVFDHVIYEANHFPASSTTAALDDFQIKSVTWDEAVVDLKELYNQSQLSKKAGLNRADWWWKYLTLKHPHCQIAVACAHNQAVGYLIYEDTPKTLVVHEVVGQNAAVTQALWAFAAKQALDNQAFTYEQPSAALNHDLLEEPSITTTIKPYMMARIVDLKHFLSEYPFSQPTEFIISITDEIIAENNGQWQVKINHDGREINKLSSQIDSDTTVITIQQLTKALFGYRSLVSQAEHGLIATSDTELLAKIDQMSVKEAPILADYF